MTKNVTNSVPVSVGSEMKPMPLATCITLACLLEVSAPKPGNVYRGADFHDMTFVDFQVSAAVIGPIMANAEHDGVGAIVLQAVQATQAIVGTNTNLGTVLLLAPLAAVPLENSLADGISSILENLNLADTHAVIEAIRLAKPGGLGNADQGDVQAETECNERLPQVMAWAADRDLVARQYTNGFHEVLGEAAEWIFEAVSGGLVLSVAIVQAHLRLIAAHGDSLIERKCGKEIASEASDRAAHVLQSGEPGESAYEQELAAFDFWLRADGNRRNPGTTADLIAAGLFVLLREARLDWPVRFYR